MSDVNATIVRSSNSLQIDGRDEIPHINTNSPSQQKRILTLLFNAAGFNLEKRVISLQCVRTKTTLLLLSSSSSSLGLSSPAIKRQWRAESVRCCMRL